MALLEVADEALVPVERLARGKRLDVGALHAALARAVSGAAEVRFDAATRALYAQDASNYRRIPLGVVIPDSVEDVIAAVAACREHGAPIVARGGGTALAGQTVNEAVVFDFSKRMNRITWIDPSSKRARIELGAVCDDLVEVVRPFGLTFGPRPATHSRCCFGGMLANNCGGMHAQRHGTAVHNVEALDVLLYDGTRMELGWMDEAALERGIRRGGAEGTVLAQLRSLRDRYAPLVRARYPKIPRRVSGYNLDELLPKEDGRFNLARVIVGSEGTLALMLEATLLLLDDPPARAMVVLGFEDVFQAADMVPALLAYEPLALEGVDDVLYEQIARKGGAHAEHLRLLSGGRGWLLVEVGGADEADVRAKGDRIVRDFGRAIVDSRIYVDERERRMLRDAREGALGSTAFVPGEPDAWPGWEDSAVAPEQLGRYLRDLRALFDRYDYHPALYGHFGMGVVHCRVPFGLEDEHGVRKFRRFMSDAADLVVAHGGSLSGEHGDGQARGELLRKMFGDELVQAMRELKSIFDPAGRMNPGKIADAYPIVDRLRLWPDYHPAVADTHFRYPDDGGSFARATLRCVGVGVCRRKHGDGEHDVMCPSYMVTREEKHSTRGRVHLLWEMLRGDGPVAGGWKDDGVKGALDLCLACKGCKRDCPMGVDLATYKAEFLSHYYEDRRRPRHAYAFGFIDKWARLAANAPGLVNLATQLPGASAMAKLVAGVSQEMRIPAFAPETFKARFARRPARRAAGDRQVVLWADTFNDHFHPDTAMAAVDVLEAAGYEVLVPQEPICCGRPLYDFGLLDHARAYLEDVLRAMRPHLEADDRPIVVLEPSCASVFKDELRGLMPGRDDAELLAHRTTTLAELLTSGRSPPPLPALKRRAVVQGHCHHKSALDFGAERTALEAMGLDFEVLESGCCGMAGAFGFVSDTHDVGHACGERVLLPRVRRERDDTLVIADGFSCREQIAQHTDRRALHLAEVLKLALDHGPAGPPDARPEDGIVRRRRREVRNSMIFAAAGLAVIGGAAVALSRWMRGAR